MDDASPATAPEPVVAKATAATSEPVVTASTAEPATATAASDPVQAAEQALEQAVAAKTAVMTAALTATEVDEVITTWLHGSIAGGPIARNTDCWNAMQASLPALKAALVKTP